MSTMTCRNLSRLLQIALRASAPSRTRCAFSVYRHKYAPCQPNNYLVRQFTVAAKEESTDSKSSLEAALKSDSIDDIVKTIDNRTDVYVTGMGNKSELADMKMFFKGLQIEDIFFIETNDSYKRFCYVRFKDEATKNRALELNKKNLDERYLEVKSVGLEDSRFCQLILRLCGTTQVRLENLPFSSTKEEVKQFLLPITVADEDIFFVQRGVCVVNLKSKSNFSAAFSKRFEQLGGRKVFMSPGLEKDAGKKLKEKYRVNEEPK